MLDIKRIRENPDAVKEGLVKRGADIALVDGVLKLDQERRGILSEVEALNGKRNKVSKEIGAAKKRGEDTTEIQKEMRELGEKISAQDEVVRDVDTRLRNSLLKIPMTALQ